MDWLILAALVALIVMVYRRGQETRFVGRLLTALVNDLERAAEKFDEAVASVQSAAEEMRDRLPDTDDSEVDDFDEYDEYDEAPIIQRP